MYDVPHLRFPEFSGEWEKYRLCDVASIVGRIGFRGYTTNDIVTKGKGAIALSPTNIENNKLTYDKDNTYISFYKYEESPEIMIKQGDVIFVKTGSTVGKVAYVDKLICKTTLNPQVVVLKDIQCDNYLLSVLMSTNKFQNAIRKIIVGGAVPTLSQAAMGDIVVTMPQATEQEKLSKFISLLDDRIATQNKIIEDLKKLKSAISKYLFARKDLLETTICLSNIATLKNGYAFQSGKYNALGKWKILTITNVPGERYINDEDCNCIINLPNDIQDHQVLKEGDILISLTGNVGRVSLCKNGNYLLNQRVGLLQLAKNVNQEFLYQILSSQRFENSMIACGQGAAQMNIGKGDVENYVLPYSSNGNNILFAAKILHSYDECIINELRRLTLLTMQKQYLLTQMFI